MTARRIAVLVLAAALALFGFRLFIRHVSLIAFNFAGAPEVRALLDQSSRDQKQLSRLDPERGAEYRKRFEQIQDVNRKLDIVALSREEIARRYEWTLLAVVAALLLAFIAAAIVSGARRERRLAIIQRALEALGRGQSDILIGDRSRDVVGRIAVMIEATSHEVGRSRRRIQYLDHLAAWQEAARRHAHEIRTPLTAARLEVDGFVSAVVTREPSLSAIATQAQVSIHEELDRLREFTRQFTSFGRIAQPRRKLDDVREALDEFVTLFSDAWPTLTLTLVEQTNVEQTLLSAHSPEKDEQTRVSVLHNEQAGVPALHPTALLDRELLRQVLVNLCNNSSLAGASCVSFTITEHRELLHIDVADDGPGVDPAIRPRLFQPYTTTRAVGEGMGLGLAICRKIMLDHDGDLELLTQSDAARGAVFRITLPKAQRT